MEQDKREIIDQLNANQRNLEDQEAQVQKDIEKMIKHMEFQEREFNR